VLDLKKGKVKEELGSGGKHSQIEKGKDISN